LKTVLQRFFIVRVPQWQPLSRIFATVVV